MIISPYIDWALVYPVLASGNLKYLVGKDIVGIWYNFSISTTSLQDFEYTTPHFLICEVAKFVNWYFVSLSKKKNTINE